MKRKKISKRTSVMQEGITKFGSRFEVFKEIWDQFKIFKNLGPHNSFCKSRRSLYFMKIMVNMQFSKILRVKY